jgi:CheY-like chemotaxis protein
MTAPVTTRGSDGARAGTPGEPRPFLLLIEDDPSNRQLVERVAARSRPAYDVVAVSGGRVGLLLAREQPPAAIVLDLGLPDLPGQEVLAELRADPATSGIPVVVVTGEARPAKALELLDAGVAAYLIKPIDIRELIEALERVAAARLVS